MNQKKQLLVSLSLFLSYCAVILTSNYIMQLAESTNNETYEMISGILFGFVGIPVFGIIMPIHFANKWRLEFSLWPKSKKVWQILLFIIAYVIITNYSSLKLIAHSNYSFSDYLIHYISTLLFHVTYYPIFIILLFPVIRKNYGLLAGIILTAILFSVYHLAQFHFFPAGTTTEMQIMLFIAFVFYIIIYLWSESVILVSLLHSINGSIGLLSNGMISNEMDFVFYLTIVIVTSLFVYYIIRERKQIRNNDYYKNWWLNFSIENK